MNMEGWVDARGWHASFITAPTEAQEVEARRALVMNAMAAFEDALLPTGVELEPGFFETELGLLSLREPPPPAMVLAEWGSPVFPTVADPERLPPCLHGLSRTDLLVALETLAAAPAPAEHFTDLVRLETIACGVPSGGADRLLLRELPSHVVSATMRDGRGWFRGPLDVPGYRYLPPARLRLTHEGGVLRLELAVHWGPWAQPGTREHEPFRDAVSKLLRAGYQADGPLA